MSERAAAPSLAEFAGLVASVAPRRIRGLEAGSLLGADLGLDALALAELDVKLFERYGGAVGFRNARPDFLALSVREAHRVCVGRGEEPRARRG